MTQLRKQFEDLKNILSNEGYYHGGLVFNSLDKMESIINDLEKLSAPKIETRVYVVRVDECESIKDGLYWLSVDNDEFMDEAERQGLIYTIDLFENDFNTNVINQQSDLIRFITVEVSE
jgi:hypothetical protein